MTETELHGLREFLKLASGQYGDEVLPSAGAWRNRYVANVARLLAEVHRLHSVIRRAYEGDPDDLYAEGKRLAGAVVAEGRP